jgi:putative pre-16S rRNA nuclease
VKGRLLGIDFGTVRIGLAVSDPLRITARPHSVLKRSELKADLEALADLVKEEQVQDIVLGLPRNTDGSSGPMVKLVEEFRDALAARLPRTPIHTYDETYSSQDADEMLRARFRDPKKRKAERDAWAAVLILRNWMDFHEG